MSDPATQEHNHTIEFVTIILVSHQVTKIKVPPKYGIFWGKKFQLKLASAFGICKAECWSACSHKINGLFRVGCARGVPWPCTHEGIYSCHSLDSHSPNRMLPASSIPTGRGGQQLRSEWVPPAHCKSSQCFYAPKQCCLRKTPGGREDCGQWLSLSFIEPPNSA